MKYLLVLISLVVSSQAEPPRSYSYVSPPTSYLPPSSGCSSCYQDQLPLQPSRSYGTPIQPQPQIIFPPQQAYQPPRQTYVAPIRSIPQPLPTYSAPNQVQTIISPVPGPTQTIVQPIPTYSAPAPSIFRPIAPVQPLSTYGTPSIGPSFDFSNHIKPAYSTPLVQPSYSAPALDFQPKNIHFQNGINEFSTGSGSFNGYNYRRP